MTDSEALNSLRIKLALIDQDCESETRTAINELQAKVKYEHGRFHAPDFQVAANLLVQVISCKEKRFNSEIFRMLCAPGAVLRPGELQQAKDFVAGYFQEERYLERFDSFVKSVGRIASRYGLMFDPQPYRVDIASSLFVVGVKNATRRGLASVHAELAMQTRGHSPNSEGKAPGLDDIVELKPNFMGFGINLNALIKRCWAKVRKNKPN